MAAGFGQDKAAAVIKVLRGVSGLNVGIPS